MGDGGDGEGHAADSDGDRTPPRRRAPRRPAPEDLADPELAPLLRRRRGRRPPLEIVFEPPDDGDAAPEAEAPEAEAPGDGR